MHALYPSSTPLKRSHVRAVAFILRGVAAARKCFPPTTVYRFGANRDMVWLTFICALHDVSRGTLTMRTGRQIRREMAAAEDKKRSSGEASLPSVDEVGVRTERQGRLVLHE